MSLAMSTDNWITDETSMKLQQLQGTRAMNKIKQACLQAKFKINCNTLFPVPSGLSLTVTILIVQA